MMEKARDKKIDIEDMRENLMIYEHTGLNYQEFRKTPKENIAVAEELFSFLAEDSSEEKIFMKQYLKK